MTKYVAITDINQGKFPPGSEVTLPQSQLDQLLQLGVIEKVEEPEPKKPTKAKPQGTKNAD